MPSDVSQSLGEDSPRLARSATSRAARGSVVRATRAGNGSQTPTRAVRCKGASGALLPLPPPAIGAGRRAVPCRGVRARATARYALSLPRDHEHLATLELVRHPVGLVQPDRAAARGSLGGTPPASPPRRNPVGTMDATSSAGAKLETWAGVRGVKESGFVTNPAGRALAGSSGAKRWSLTTLAMSMVIRSARWRTGANGRPKRIGSRTGSYPSIRPPSER